MKFVDRSVVTPEAWHGSILLHRLHLGRWNEVKFQASIFGNSTGFPLLQMYWLYIDTDYKQYINLFYIYHIILIYHPYIMDMFFKFKPMFMGHFIKHDFDSSATRLTSSDHPSMEATDTLSRMKWSKSTNAPSTLGGHKWDEIVRFRSGRGVKLESQNRREYWNRME